jgi:putative (di)nucleoside polyphosphate hydrolase
MSAPQGGYRPCVGVALFHRDGRVFLGKRAGIDDRVPGAFAWQMPQGGIDDGETPLQAAWRELREETGVTRARLLAEAPDWLAYDLPDEMLRPNWRGRWRGQTQKWFAFRFEGDDAEIDIGQAEPGQKPEFDRWRWGELATAPALVVPFKRPVYAQIAQDFALFAQPHC